MWYLGQFQFAQFNSNFHFLHFQLDYFFSTFGPKNQNCQLKAEIWYLDLLEYEEFNIHAHFFCFGPEKTSLDKFGSKNIIVSLRLNLVPILLLICRIWRWWSYFRLEIPFLDKFVPKYWKLSVSVEIWYLG